MVQAFYFVDATHIDKSTKKRMRRHVMIGKNAGKTIARRSKKGSLKHHTMDNEDVSIYANSVSVRKTSAKLDYYGPASVYNNVLSGPCFPVELTPEFSAVISTCRLKSVSN